MISIIIPVYNHGKVLSKCLESIFKQSYQNFEIIVINDGSTDNTKEVINKYQGKVKKIIHQENKGANAARNRGYREAEGNYLLFCDADMVLNPEMLERMICVLEKDPAISYVYSSFKCGFKLFRLWPFDGERLKKMNYIHTSSLMRKEYFPGFDEKIKKFQDWDLWLTMFEQGYYGKWLPEILFKIVDKGVMSRWLPKFFYKISWQRMGIRIKTIEKYQEALRIIQKKHGLNIFS